MIFRLFVWGITVSIYLSAAIAWFNIFKYSGLLRIESITVTTDNSFTSLDGEQFQESLMGLLFDPIWTLSDARVSEIISAFQQVESAAVTSHLNGSIRLSLKLRQPLVEIQSGSTSIALDRTAHPFRFDSQFTNSLITITLQPSLEEADLLNPSIELQAFYKASVYLSHSKSARLRQFLILDSSRPNEVRLLNSQKHARIRLGLRSPELSLMRLDNYMETVEFDNATEFDLRLTDLMVIRRLSLEMEGLNG